MCIVVEGVEHADQLNLNLKKQIINSEKVHDRLNESKKEHTKPAFYLERYPGGKINRNFLK